MSELPKGWVDVSIDDITSDVSYGVTAKSDPLEGDLQLLRITDIQGNRVDWSSVPYCNYESKYESSRLKDNDIVVARTGATVGKSFLIENAVDDSVYASYLIRLRVAEGTLPKYLAKFLHTPLYWKQISEQKAGIGQPNVNGTKLKTLRMSLAPLAEQKRIVEKLDEVLAQVDTIKARLDGIPALLKRFRQSVLASAVSGKLTEEWRELNFHVKKITIDDYLDNVTKLRKEAHKSSCLNEKRKRRYVEPDECLELVFTKLPYCWRLESLASLTYRITYGLTVRPKYTEVGTPIISAKEIRSGSIDYDSAKRFNKADFSNQREKCKIYLNDILFSKTGSIGHVALVERDVEMCSSQNIAVLSPRATA
ncbi:restriction endonuclease subunit S [Vibrio breoganii]